MSGSCTDRSATSYAATTAATIGAAEASAGKLSHCRGPSTLRTVAPSTEIGGRFVDQVDHQGARRPALLVQPGQRPVVHRRAVVDDDHPPAERLDVLEVVGGEQQRGPALGVEGAQELAEPALAHHVEADGGLVEVEDLRVVQERGGDVAAHPLAEAELPDRDVEQVAEAEQLDELRQVGSVPLGVGPVDLLQQVEGVAQRQVPPQRGALAEDHADPAGQLGALAAGVDARDADRAGGRHQDAGEHLDRGRLAGAVRADVADHLAGLDLEAQLLHGLDVGPAADPEGAGQPGDLDEGHRSAPGRAVVAHSGAPHERVTASIAAAASGEANWSPGRAARTGRRRSRT